MSKNVREKFEAWFRANKPNLSLHVMTNNGEFYGYSGLKTQNYFECYQAAHAESAARIAELEAALIQAKFDIQYLYNNTDKHVAIKRIDQAINETKES